MKPSINHCFAGQHDIRDLAAYTHTEVDLIQHDAEDCTRIDEADKDTNPNAIYYWSVYLRIDPDHPENEGFGGAECVADFPTKPVAQAFAEFLDHCIKWARDEAKKNNPK